MGIGAVYVTVRVVKGPDATIYGSEHGEKLTRRMYLKKRCDTTRLFNLFLVLLEMYVGLTKWFSVACV